MDRSVLPINNSGISFLLCDICKENKGRSRKFHSSQALKWHLTHDHFGELQN